ncbi:MAG: type IV secretion system protein [Pseudomonadota bacterium]
MTLGGEMPDKGEFFKFGAKYILVLYFSVGIYTSTASNGAPVYTDGVRSIMLPLFEGGSIALANIVYSAGGSTGLCQYDPASYPAVTNGTKGFYTSYGYLSLWDSLDCRILYYLGFAQLSALKKTVEKQGFVSIASIGVPVLLSMFMPALLSFQIIFAVFLITFMVFLISIIIYLVNIVVLCSIGMAILIYLAPVFVPMALFSPTKGFFDGWLKLLISYALQPMIVAAYIALMMTVFDQAMFGQCAFKSSVVNFSLTGGGTKQLPFFELCDPDNPSSGCSKVTKIAGATKCKETIGYQINSANNFIQSISALFFNIAILKPQVVGNMLTSLISLVLFAFLFYQFAELLSEFAAEVTGGTNIGSLAGNPMAFVNFAAIMAKAGVKYALKDKEGAAKDVAKAFGVDKMAEKAGSVARSVSSGAEGSTGDNTPPSGTKITTGNK